jgi:hypothetical protein
MAQIPIDLYPEILQALFYNKPALYNCALVCRSWRVAAQGFIFTNINLKAEASPYRRIMSLSALFSQSPHIPKSVRNFSVYPRDVTRRVHVSRLLYANPDLVAALDKYGIIDRMIRLQTLRIYAISPFSQISEGMLSVLSRLQDIRHIHLQSTRIPSFDALLIFFPSLSSIRLNGVDFSQSSTIAQDSGLDTVFFRINISCRGKRLCFPVWNCSRLPHFTLNWACCPRLGYEVDSDTRYLEHVMQCFPTSMKSLSLLGEIHEPLKRQDPFRDLVLGE